MAEDPPMTSQRVGTRASRTRTEHYVVCLGKLWTICTLMLAGCRLATPLMVEPSGVLSGAPVWRDRTADSITSTPGQGPGTVYVRTEKSLIALSTDSGAELWRTESPSVAPLSLPPKLVDHVVVVTETGSRIAAFDLETGRSLWRTAAISVSGLYSPKIDDL